MEYTIATPTPVTSSSFLLNHKGKEPLYYTPPTLFGWLFNMYCRLRLGTGCVESLGNEIRSKNIPSQHEASAPASGIRSGDTVRVWQKIEEIKTGKGANKKDVMTKNVRKQAFEGLVLAVKHGNEPGATFTVRNVSSGVGVEKIFPLYSPMIDSIEVLAPQHDPPR